MNTQGFFGEFRISDWKHFLVLALLVYTVALGLRLLQAPDPAQPGLQVDGEYIMTTHDAYYWLAWAKHDFEGVRPAFGTVTKVIHEAAGIPLDRIGFWGPAVFASLIAVAVLAWGWVLGSLEAGFCAGILASLFPGFLYRTGLGFYDTDLGMLLLPLLMSVGMAAWLKKFLLTPMQALQQVTRRKVFDSEELPLSLPWLVVLFLSGIFALWVRPWHNFMEYMGTAFPLIALFLTILCAKQQLRATMLLGVLVYSLPMLLGLVGAVGSLVVVILYAIRKDTALAFINKPRAGWILVGVVLLAALDIELVNRIVNNINVYLKPAEQASGGVSVAFPSVAQSVIEAQNLSWEQVFTNFHLWLPVAVLGIVCAVLLCFVEPVALFLSPLLLLALASPWLGGRMTIFAAPLWSLGVSLVIIGGTFKFIPAIQSYKKILLSIAVCAVFAFPHVLTVLRMPVFPITSPQYVNAAKAVRSVVEPDVRFWTWWDWGYTTQYYTGALTQSDGARHNTSRLYPLAAVYTTTNPLFANQMIKYAAKYGYDLGGKWGNLDAEEVYAITQKLGSEEMDIEPPAKQYLVVTFDALKLAQWITRFGSWDFRTRTWKPYNISSFKNGVRLNTQQGFFKPVNGNNVIGIESLDVYKQGELIQKDYLRFSGVHLVINDDTGDSIAVDNNMYNSMLYRLLLGNPHDSEITAYFKLIEDNVRTRIYEVL